MKKLVILLVLLMGMPAIGQSIDYNTKRGYVANGYDVVAYFSGKSIEGKKEFTTVHDGVKYKFATQENLSTFKSDPGKYVPLYGGYCAYAVATKSEKVSIDPETYEIRDGRLLLFYNSWGTNTLKLWKKESPKELKVQADKNWDKIKSE